MPQVGEEAIARIKTQLKTRAYPCIERGEVVWTYMGPPELKPEFPDLEWTQVPAAQRFATRHIQECNWLQGVEGGFDATHLTFLHGGDTEHSRRIVADDVRSDPDRFRLHRRHGPRSGQRHHHVERQCAC